MCVVLVRVRTQRNDIIIHDFSHIRNMCQKSICMCVDLDIQKYRIVGGSRIESAGFINVYLQGKYTPM